MPSIKSTPLLSAESTVTLPKNNRVISFYFFTYGPRTYTTYICKELCNIPVERHISVTLREESNAEETLFARRQIREI